MINAVGYIRMSSDKQEASPAQQRNEVTALAKRDGYRVIRWYIDEGVSGDATEKRFEFQRMIRDSGSGEFQAVFVLGPGSFWKIRLHRSRALDPPAA